MLLALLALSDGYVLIDPMTGRVLEKSLEAQQRFQEAIRQQQLLAADGQSQADGDATDSELPPRHIPAPEYYATDGRTPIYKVLNKNPYGKRW